MAEYSFLSGLPRSGSTLMTALLNQHPEIHASATSGLLELIDAQATAIMNQRKYYAISDEQEISVLKGLFPSFYSHIAKGHIVDKHRMWPNLIVPLRKLGIEPKILCSNRPIAEIVASYILLIEKSQDPNNNIDSIIRSRGMPINLYSRAMTIWSDYIRIPHTCVVNGLKAHGDSFFVFDYQTLASNPPLILRGVESFLGVDSFNGYNFSSVKNEQTDKDGAWNLKGLHDVRPTVGRTSPPPEEVIGQELTNYFQQFDIRTGV